MIKLEFKNDMYVQCCVCKKFSLEDGTYAHVVVDDAFDVSHTYYLECHAVVMAEFKAMKK